MVEPRDPVPDGTAAVRFKSLQVMEALWARRRVGHYATTGNCRTEQQAACSAGTELRGPRHIDQVHMTKRPYSRGFDVWSNTKICNSDPILSCLTDRAAMASPNSMHVRKSFGFIDMQFIRVIS
jgi:hypothetical protein